MLPDDVLLGIQLFNRGEFFAAHEALEAAWRRETGQVRYLYQGILQVGVACYHLQHNNISGADHLLTRGLAFLYQFENHETGIHLQKLITDAEKLKQFVERAAQNPTLLSGLPAFPQIELSKK